MDRTPASAPDPEPAIIRGADQESAHALGAVILAGGASSRMGADKARLDWNGRQPADRIAEVARAVGAGWVVTAGGGSGLGTPSAPDLDGGGGGPVAGIAAGLSWLTARRCTRALVLAIDAPTLMPGDIQPLTKWGSPGAVFDGLNLPMVIDLEAVPLRRLGAGQSVERLIREAGLARLIPDPRSVLRLRGANTPWERRRLLDELLQREAGPARDGEASAHLSCGPQALELRSS